MRRNLRPKCRLVIVLSALLLMPTVAAAHGEEILVFPISLGVLLVPALGIVAVRWHPVWWVRLLTALVLIGSNVALWFSPIFPRTVGAFAGYDLRKAMAILLVAPLFVAVGAGVLLKRLAAGRAA